MIFYAELREGSEHVYVYLGDKGSGLWMCSMVPLKWVQGFSMAALAMLARTMQHSLNEYTVERYAP